MIKKLLLKDKTKRLGAQGEDEILKHKFFRGINVKKVMAYKFKAPYVPEKTDLNDIEIDPQCRKQLLEQDTIPEQLKKMIDKQQD